MELETSAPTGGDSQSFESAAATAVTPDAETAAILAKHQRGEKLTPREGGKLGWLKKQLKAVATRAENPFAEKSTAAVSPATVSDQTPAAGFPAVAPDPGFVQRTTLAVLNRTDAVTVRWIEREARAAGASGDLLDKFRASASLSLDDKKIISDISPDLLAAFGVDPKNYPLTVALSIVGLHATSLLMAVNELKAMRAERGVSGPQSATPGASPTPAIVPIPPSPPNAPATIHS